MTFEEEEYYRKQGWNHFWKDDSKIDDNPYSEDSDEYTWWAIGFMDGFNEGF